jgi:alpha-mannosidase
MKNMTGTGVGLHALSIGMMALVLCIFAGLFGEALAVAQSEEQAAQVVKSLDTNSQAVVGRLSGLNRLLADEWRFHPGDMAHGESPDLDDSGWQIVKAQAKGAQEAEWFRRWIEVPQSLHGYDLTGARIWFSFSANANGPMPEIIYFNGRRVALGDDLEPIVLFDKAKPGEKVLVAVKLLHTVDNKTFGGAELKIDFAENRPNPEDLRIEILSSALLVPSLSKNAPADTATLEKAAGAVDLAALDAKDQAKFDASLT